MMQLPMEIWERIWMTQTLRTELGRNLMSLALAGEEMLTATFQRHETLMSQAGYPSKVITAYHQLVIPWAENQAIQRFVADLGDLDLAGALPDLVELADVRMLAGREWRLTPQEEGQLIRIMPTSTPTPEAREILKMWDRVLPLVNQTAP